MRKYFERMREEKTTHERRQWALRAAGTLSAILFLGWAATLGVRFASPTQQVSSNNADQSQGAAVAGLYGQQENTLQVATTSIYTNY